MLIDFWVVQICSYNKLSMKSTRRRNKSMHQVDEGAALFHYFNDKHNNSHKKKAMKMNGFKLSNSVKQRYNI